MVVPSVLADIREEHFEVMSTELEIFGRCLRIPLTAISCAGSPASVLTYLCQ